MSNKWCLVKKSMRWMIMIMVLFAAVMHGAVVHGAPSTAGKTAVSFDGKDDTIDFGSDEALEFKKGESFSISLLMKTRSGVDANVGLFTKGYLKGSHDNFKPSLYSIHLTSGKLRFMVRNHEGQGSLAKTTTSLTDDRWHHVVAVYDADDAELQVYVDGMLEKTVTGVKPGEYGTETGPLVSGEVAGNYYSGQLNDIRLYGNALSETDVQDLYKGGQVEEGLVGWWPISEGDGDVVKDVVGENHGRFKGDVKRVSAGPFVIDSLPGERAGRPGKMIDSKSKKNTLGSKDRLMMEYSFNKLSSRKNINDLATPDDELISKSSPLTSLKYAYEKAVTPGETVTVGPLHLRFPQGKVKYQWYHDGEPIQGAVSSRLKLSNISAEDLGDYSSKLVDNRGVPAEYHVRIRPEGTDWEFDTSGRLLLDKKNGKVVVRTKEGTTVFSNTDAEPCLEYALEKAKNVLVTDGMYGFGSAVEIPRSGVTLVIGPDATVRPAKDADMDAWPVLEGLQGAHFRPFIHNKGHHQVRIIHLGTLSLPQLKDNSAWIPIWFDGRPRIQGGLVYSPGNIEKHPKRGPCIGLHNADYVRGPFLWAQNTVGLWMEGCRYCDIGTLVNRPPRRSLEGETLDLNAFNAYNKIETVISFGHTSKKDEVLDVNGSPHNEVGQVIGWSNLSPEELVYITPHAGERWAQGKEPVSKDSTTIGNRVRFDRDNIKGMRKKMDAQLSQTGDRLDVAAYFIVDTKDGRTFKYGGTEHFMLED